MSAPVVSDYTVREFAQKTKQSEHAVYRKCRNGTIPSYKIGGALRIRREDAEQIRQPSNRLSAELREQIKAAVDHWPALTPEQRAEINTLFTVGGGSVD
ncbi:MAG: helix-turn-helix domain-containing protein [Actinomycetota bacterium]|nr:helix-turn-helix domain-containing protein [Actinomycetota bacterium]